MPLLDSLGEHGDVFSEAVKQQLSPRSSRHTKIMELINDFMNASRREMANRYSRWQDCEQRYWAIVDKTEVEAMKAKNLPTFDKEIIVPVTFFTLQSRLTNIMQLLFGRPTLFPMSTGDERYLLAVKKLEAWCEQQVKLGQAFEFGHNLYLSADLYGVGFRKTTWDYENELVYNEVVDPFMTFPDTRISIVDPLMWEYIGFQYLRSWNNLKSYPYYFNLEEISKMERKYMNYWDPGDRSFGKRTSNKSVRNTSFNQNNNRSGKIGERDRGVFSLREVWAKIVASDYFDIDELVDIVRDAGKEVPDDWDPDRPQVWVFTDANGNTVIRGEPDPHGLNMLPAGAVAPFHDGLSVLPPGMAEMMIPLQDILSWLASSRMHNVYRHINERTWIDPSIWRITDYQAGADVVRLNKEAHGTDVRRGIYHHTPSNVTESHWSDFQQIYDLVQRMSAATDPIQGSSEKVEQTLGQFEGLLSQAMGRHADIANRYYSQDWMRWQKQFVGLVIANLPEETKVELTADVARELELIQTDTGEEMVQQVLTREELFDTEGKQIDIKLEFFDPRSMNKKSRDLQTLLQVLQFFQDPQLRQEFPNAVPTLMLEIGIRANMPGMHRVFKRAMASGAPVPGSPIPPTDELAGLALTPPGPIESGPLEGTNGGAPVQMQEISA